MTAVTGWQTQKTTAICSRFATHCHTLPHTATRGNSLATDSNIRDCCIMHNDTGMTAVTVAVAEAGDNSDRLANCNTLQRTATHLQHTAAYCNTLQHTAAHCNTIECWILCNDTGVTA